MRIAVLPVSVALCCAPALAQTWKDYMTAGMRAAGARNLPEAEKLLLKASEEGSRFGETDSRYGTTLNDLGLVYRQEKKYAPAEAAFQHSREILVKSNGPASPDVANVDYNLAGVRMDLGNYSGALEDYQKALPIYERWFGRDGAKTGLVLQDIGECNRRMKRFPEAEKYFKEAASVRESSLGIDSPELGETMNSLGMTYAAEGKVREGEAAFKLALSIREAALGLQSEPVRSTLENYADLLQKSNRSKEAARLLTLAHAIRVTAEKP